MSGLPRDEAFIPRAQESPVPQTMAELLPWIRRQVPSDDPLYTRSIFIPSESTWDLLTGEIRFIDDSVDEPPPGWSYFLDPENCVDVFTFLLQDTPPDRISNEELAVVLKYYADNDTYPPTPGSSSA